MIHLLAAVLRSHYVLLCSHYDVCVLHIVPDRVWSPVNKGDKAGTEVVVFLGVLLFFLNLRLLFKNDCDPMCHDTVYHHPL